MTASEAGRQRVQYAQTLFGATDLLAGLHPQASGHGFPKGFEKAKIRQAD
jgi:hypothetical protein